MWLRLWQTEDNLSNNKNRGIAVVGKQNSHRGSTNNNRNSYCFIIYKSCHTFYIYKKSNEKMKITAAIYKKLGIYYIKLCYKFSDRQDSFKFLLH